MVRFHDRIHERTPYDPHRLAKCITTNGGQTNYHPSGLRNFSPRERARLQTFRNAYRFTGTVGEVNRQVGNAVPPAVWRCFMGSVAQCLRDFAHGRIDAAGAPQLRRPIPVPRPRIPTPLLWRGWLAALAEDDRRRIGGSSLPPVEGLAAAVAAAVERAERRAREARGHAAAAAAALAPGRAGRPVARARPRYADRRRQRAQHADHGGVRRRPWCAGAAAAAPPPRPGPGRRRRRSGTGRCARRPSPARGRRRRRRRCRRPRRGRRPWRARSRRC